MDTRDKVRAYLLYAMAPLFFIGGLVNLGTAWTVQSKGEAVQAKIEDITTTYSRKGGSTEHVHLVAQTSAGEQRCEVTHRDMEIGGTLDVLVVPAADGGEATCREPGFASVWGLGLLLTFIAPPIFLVLGKVVMNRWKDPGYRAA